MIPVENQVYRSNFFGSGEPNAMGIIAAPGVEYTDVSKMIRYRQVGTPKGKKWVPVAVMVSVPALTSLKISQFENDSGYLAEVATDGVSILGDGTPDNPLSANTVGGANLWAYKAKTNSTSGSPGTGFILWNNSTQVSATAINIDDTTDDGFDIELFFQFIQEGDYLVIQDRADSANYQIWVVDAPPTIVVGSHVEVPVSLSSSGGTGTTNFPNNRKLSVARIPQTASGSSYISSVSDTPTIDLEVLLGNLTAAFVGTTDNVPEGSNQYFTQARVLATLLSGLAVSGGTITAADNILQAFGKLQNQINAVLGGVSWQGLWNATTNSPTITSSTGTKGHYYVVNVAGSTNIDGITDWKIGDWIIFDGTTWGKVDNTDNVISVNGQSGIIVLTTADIADSTNKRYVTDAQLVVLGNTSGINTGDQTTIAGITGTMAQFNAACSDGDFVYTSTAKIVMIAQSGATITAPNTLNEEALANILIPAGTIGDNDNLIVEALFDVAAGTGNKIPRIRLHSATGIGGTIYQATTIGNSGAGYAARARIAWKNASNSQEGFGQTTAVYGTGNLVVTGSLSNASDIYVNITLIKVSTAADVATLRNYSVYIIRA